MQRRKFITIGLIVVLLSLAASGLALAQASTRFDLGCWGIFTTAGGQMASPTFRVATTVGQVAAGTVESANARLRIGYQQDWRTLQPVVVVPGIDQWHISSGNVDYTADRYMYGNQAVRVEHYDEGAGALLNFSFAPIGTVNPVTNTGSDWDASYFSNPDLAGGPVIARGEARSSYPLDLDWGLNSPAPGAIGNDNWSARWRGRFFFEAGDFMFQARSDDGVRVYIDGLRVIDAWYDGYKEPSNHFLSVGRGDHEIVVEFYERGGTAFNQVW